MTTTSSKRQQPRTNNDDDEEQLSPLPIYTAPTTDTWGEEESFLGRLPFLAFQTTTPLATTTSYHQQHGVTSSSSPEYAWHLAANNSRNSNVRISTTTTTRPTDAEAHNHNNNKRHSRNKQPQRKKKIRNVDFQHTEDWMRVMGVQTIDLSQRSAFEVRPLLSLADWQRLVDQASAAAGKSVAKRFSPSYQHLQILHRLQNTTVLRQVHFSPSVSLDSDPFVPWDDDDDDDDARDDRQDHDSDKKNGSTSAAASATRKYSSSTTHRRRDGRYRSIHPVQATVQALPSPAPSLSHKKSRPVMRTDVGFPHASAEEIQQKQNEIRHETAWEEASPRLVVLITSEDIGTAVVGDVLHATGSRTTTGTGSSSSSRIGDALKAWNGGGVEGIPYAGKQLMQALERNARHFGKKSCLVANPKILQANPYSMLAPPLDATYSASQGWRPRPIHDRPAGRTYLLTCPLQIEMNMHTMEKKEPVVCSLALYNLSADDRRGKMSEDFWFPAGDWTGQVFMEATRRAGDGKVDPDLVALWLDRKQKAIFSYDPLEVPFPRASLYVVLKVYRRIATKNEEGAPSQLLHPLCFGAAPAYPTDPKIEWPRGESREMELFSYDSVSDSQEGFVERLAVMMLRGSLDTAEPSILDLSEHSSGSDLAVDGSMKKKKRGMSRLFRTPTKAPKAGHVTPTQTVAPECVGRSKIFAALLNNDFLQSLLANPPELPTGEVIRKLPRLLVDVSGDFAVALEEDQNERTEPINSVKKKSSLLRLPVASQPAGYLGSSEYREVLCLPIRPEKHYFSDSALSYRSILNFIFLYPRLLRADSDDNRSNKGSNLTVRFQLLRTENVSDANSGRTIAQKTVLAAFHNPTSWSNGNLVKDVFTSVRTFVSEPDEYKSGILLGDEFKLRLPILLDGSYSLRVSLFETQFLDESSTRLKLLVETCIPLSSCAPRDGSSGARVATVIPNGNHRLKLGNFQLQLETRLLSSVHTGDPSVAHTLRDFPYALDDSDHVPRSMPLALSSTSFGDVSDRPLFGASESSTSAHFYPLMHMHLWNLAHAKDERNESLIKRNMSAMFEVLNKVRAYIQASSRPSSSEKSIRAFLKQSLDWFDEGSLSTSRVWSNIAVESSHVNEQASAALAIANSVEEDDVVQDARDEHDGGAVRTKRSLSRSEGRVNRIISSAISSGTPFSRVAYGATKTDRMRLEAELHHNADNYSPFFEDDETVATAPTIFSSMETIRREAARESITLLGEHTENSILRTSSSGTSPHGQSKSGNAEFANRVRTVAQVMLAPCVGPSLSNMLAGKSNSPRHTQQEKVNSFATEESAVATTPSSLARRFVCCPGSDNESSEDDAEPEKQGSFRGPIGPLLTFSLAFEKSNEIPTGCGEYLYESIMLLWLRAWLDHVEEMLKNESATSASGVATFPIPPIQPDSSSAADVFSYYAHMDYLLPLCLKSIALRCSFESPVRAPTEKAVLDSNHLVILEAFVELLGRGLVGQALSGLQSSKERDEAVALSLSSSEVVHDFLVGLIAVLHPQHMNLLLKKYFNTLRGCETEHLDEHQTGHEFQWTDESLHRVRCTRQLRIRTIEVLSALPGFLALNYPSKFAGEVEAQKMRKASWMSQYRDIDIDNAESHPHDNGSDRVPPSGWLAELLLGEGLSVCSLSSEAVVAEAMAHVEVSHGEATPALMKRPGATLKRDDLLMFQSLAIHSITVVYELLLRRHAMDRRFQNETCRQRIAALFAKPMLDKSLASVRWLARMEPTHKVRSIWLLGIVYVLQEAPEGLLRDYIRSCCNPEGMGVHRFIRLLRLCSSTFQSFVDLPRHAKYPSEIERGMAPWLLQESFNTICATINMVVEECVSLTSSYPIEQQRIMHGILDLLLRVLTTPQSSVTHLRAIGGALQALEEFGISFFLEITATTLQHWIRVVLSLMNSVSLSVRSIAIDFVVSLLGSAYDLEGNIEDLAMIFVTVLPEVVAREIGLYIVSGHISSMDDVAKALWPLRRSIADLEDANPLDDDRIDPQLPPILSVFCRACQAVIDGVLIELKLKGDNLSIVGTKVSNGKMFDAGFDADEESLYEAAIFFVPESGPLQRVRWLSTLASLHEAKKQWIEAAETLFLCARTIADSIPHLRSVWRPSRFLLWSDPTRSLWLETVGEDAGKPEQGNSQVMNFADEFLEPAQVWNGSTSPTGQLLQPTLGFMCNKLVETAKKAVALCLGEIGSDELAYARLEDLQKSLSSVLDQHTSQGSATGISRGFSAAARKRHVGDEAELRQALATISGDMTRLAERLLLIVESQPTSPKTPGSPGRALRRDSAHRPCFVVLRFSGKKAKRFEESTTLPTFVEWDTPCVCRVSRSIVARPSSDPSELLQQLCHAFAEPFVTALRRECGPNSVVLRTTNGTASQPPDVPDKTIVHVFPVEAIDTVPTVISSSSLIAKRFLQRGSKPMAEMTVAHPFPCALSRQRVLIQKDLA